MLVPSVFGSRQFQQTKFRDAREVIDVSGDKDMLRCCKRSGKGVRVGQVVLRLEARRAFGVVPAYGN